MGLRGRKPVDIELLKGHATQWACLLYALRDGQGPGSLQKMELGPCEKVRMGKQMVPVRKIIRSEAIFQNIAPGSTEQAKAERMLKEISKSARASYHYSRPISPHPEVWEQWKRAKQVGEMKNAIRKIQKWGRTLRGSKFRVSVSDKKATLMLPSPKDSTDIKQIVQSNFVAWYLLPPALSSPWAIKILRAKRLWNYPRTNRPQSDDKRIQFFAKALAGLTLGIAPATATKRLAHWRWPKNWTQKRTEGEQQ